MKYIHYDYIPTGILIVGFYILEENVNKQSK